MPMQEAGKIGAIVGLATTDPLLGLIAGGIAQGQIGPGIDPTGTEYAQATAGAEEAIGAYEEFLGEFDPTKYGVDWQALGGRLEDIIGGGRYRPARDRGFDPESEFMQQAEELTGTELQEQALWQDISAIGEQEMAQMGDVLAATGQYRGGALGAQRADITERMARQYRQGVAGIRSRAQQMYAQLMGVERGAQLQEQSMRQQEAQFGATYQQQQNMALANLLMGIAGQEASQGRWMADTQRAIQSELAGTAIAEQQVARTQRGIGEKVYNWLFGG